MHIKHSAECLEHSLVFHKQQILHKTSRQELRITNKNESVSNSNNCALKLLRKQTKNPTISMQSVHPWHLAPLRANRYRINIVTLLVTLLNNDYQNQLKLCITSL